MLEVFTIVLLFVGIGIAMHMDAAPRSTRVTQATPEAAKKSDEKPTAASAT